MSASNTGCAIALFCEDIREEKSGAETLIGLFPDNVLVPTIPSALPRLSIYIRYHGLTGSPPKSLEFSLIAPWTDKALIKYEVPNHVIEKGVLESKDGRLPMFGLISRLQTQNWLIEAPGLVLLKVLIDGHHEMICGQMNIRASADDGDKT